VSTDLLPVLQDFYRDKLQELLRHIAGARLISQYDANNTYQYVINREETQLSWVGQVIVGLDGAVAADSAEPSRPSSGKDAAQTILREDLKNAESFYERWRPRVDAMSNAHARHRNMLNVILGETQEQIRFFKQALAGQTDLLGRRTEGVGALVGEVMPTRWIE
jgi:hypothetical protein